MDTSLQTDTLSTRLAEALRLIDVAVEDARAKLLAQPDNPRVQRLPGRTNAFVISAHEMTRRGYWEVFRHDWLAQYGYARELLEGRKFSALRQLLSGGGYRDASHGFRAFAPEVIERVRAITGDLRAAVSLTDASAMATERAISQEESPLRAPRMRN